MIAYAFYEADTRIQQYALALARRGDVVDVIALRRQDQPQLEVLKGVNVYRIQRRTVNERGRLAYLFRILRFLFHSAIVLTQKHLADSYQLVHVHSVPDFLIFATAVPKLLGVQAILDIHDLLPEFYASKFQAGPDSVLFKLLLLIEKWSIAFADHVLIANHLWHQRLLSRGASPDKCTTVCNCPDPELFFPRPRSESNGRFLITYPGSLNWHQGVDVAIRAFAHVSAQVPEAEFHIYGEGPAKPALVELTKELRLGNKVLFHDSLPTEQIVEIMAHSDLAVVPKRAGSSFGNEAASTKILEFMALGVPLIVSKTKIDSYYFNDSLVKFFKSENEEELAASILLLKRDPKLRGRLAANAVKYAQQNNWDVKKEEYLRLVDSLVVASPRNEVAQAVVRHEKRMEGRAPTPGLRLDRAASVHLVHPIAQLLNRRQRSRIPILMYHGIRNRMDGRHPYYETTTSPRAFAQQMRFLHQHGYAAITLDKAVNRLFEQRTDSQKYVVITFDDGYGDFYTDAYPILAEYDFAATVFLVTGFIEDRRSSGRKAEYLSWGEVRELGARGIQIGSHTVTHRELKSLDFPQIEEEVANSKRTIEDEIGDEVKSFSYPYAFPETQKDFTCSLAELLERHGYQNGVSTIIGTVGPGDHRFFLPRLPVNSWDDLRFFHAKLEGGYDWLHKPQYLVKMVKGLQQNRRANSNRLR